MMQHSTQETSAPVVTWSLSAAQGSCGFGVLDQGQWPYWSVAALSTSNQYFEDGPLQGCGMCFEVQCVESGPVCSP